MAEIKWTTVHPIPWRNTSFTWLPYWIFDIIAASDDWREYTGVYQDIFDTLKQAYEDYGDVDFIESRNGYIHKLSTYTPVDPVVTITPKTKPSSFKVGDPDLDVATLFTVVPSDTAVTLTTADATKASIVSGKVHAVAAGDVVITATAGSVTATLTITVTAADPAP